ncbi:MAG: hypothetical protein EOO10_12080 [Chitinophagaceae bacterium]|nr:MAG: hypothetical protein EOO10_12080 [Chitinophagaceae bacterium]
MTTNNKPWQAIVNPENLSKAATTDNTLTVAEKKSGASYQSNAYAKVLTPKRYSIDDNGGGYRGL